MTATSWSSARRSTEAVSALQRELPYGVELERVADQPTTVKDAVWEFERSLLEALVIVLIVSLLSLGWRTGIVVAMSVPLVLGVVAVVMLVTGWNLERISLGSLIIALGLLVDDSIISPRNDGGEDRGRLGPGQSSGLLLFGNRRAPAHGSANHCRGVHAHRVREVELGRVCGRDLLDRRRRGAVLVDGVRSVHPLPGGQVPAKGSRQASRWRRSLPDAVLSQAPGLDRSRDRSAAGRSSVEPLQLWRSLSSG